LGLSKFKFANIISAFTEPIIVRVLLIPLLLVFLLVAGPGACGNKGPLTLPDEDEEIKKQE